VEHRLTFREPASTLSTSLPDEDTSRGPDPTPVMVHLSGAHRGRTNVLMGDEIAIGTAPTAQVHLSDRDRPAPGARHATLKRRGRTYELLVTPAHEVWVNGESVESLVLASGDVLEIGRGGPVLRFRQYAPGARLTKSLPEVFSDCVECAKHASEHPLGRMGALVTEVPRELATQTSGIFRIGVTAVLLALTVSTLTLARRNQALEATVSAELDRIAELAQQLQGSEPTRITQADIERWRAELAAEASDADRRLEALEERSGAASRVVANAAGTIAFLQGAYGFRDPDSGLPLRMVPGPDGRPIRNRLGMPLVTLEGDGPVFEVIYTGTGFVASPDGLILTNRHVALPWEFDAAARQIIERGLEPVMLRFEGYLPGYGEPFAVSTVRASETADVALLRCSEVTEAIAHLPLASAVPEAGDEVIVLGYPLGLRALLARLVPEVARQITSEGDPDFWETARRLAEGGYIGPLASQGESGDREPAHGPLRRVRRRNHQRGQRWARAQPRRRGRSRELGHPPRVWWLEPRCARGARTHAAGRGASRCGGRSRPLSAPARLPCGSIPPSASLRHE
jgi:S1-C subfamily serine protease